MRARAVSVSLFVAAGLILAPVNMALADTATVTHPGVTTSTLAKEKAKARADVRRLEKLTHDKRSFVLGGSVSAVDTTTSTLTFTVHGGRYKALRGTGVTVSVPLTAKITREGAVDGVPVLLSAVLVGDHVVVKSRDFTFTVTTAVVDGASAVTATVIATVNRVAASPTAASVAPVVVTDPVIVPAA